MTLGNWSLILGKMSKDKGGRGEREACKLLTAWWGAEFAKTPGSGAIATILNMHDIGLTGDAITPEDFPFNVEVKRHDSDWNFEQLIKSDKAEVWGWWTQTRNQADYTGEKPLLMMRKNHNPWFFMMLLDDAPFPDTYPGRWLQCEDLREDQVVVGLFSDLAKVPKEEWTE